MFGNVSGIDHADRNISVLIGTLDGGWGYREGRAMVENDFFGTPEFVVSSIATESAGNGNVRIYNYVRRGNLMVPQFSIFIAAADLIVSLPALDAAGHNIFSADQRRMSARH